MLNTPAACTGEEFVKLGKNKRISVEILAVSKLGWAAAPFKKGKAGWAATKKAAASDKDQEKPKPLFEPEEVHPTTGQVLSVRLYNFCKASANTDRGSRDDSSVSVLRVGQVPFLFLFCFVFRHTLISIPTLLMLLLFVCLDCIDADTYKHIHSSSPSACRSSCMTRTTRKYQSSRGGWASSLPSPSSTW